MDKSHSTRKGFTLIELVVVVMILGILAAIAVPRFLDTSHEAYDNCLRQSLRIIRDAIESYTADHAGALPGADGDQGTLKSDLSKYLLRGKFPKCLVGEAKNDQIRMFSGGGSVVSSIGATAATHSWAYNYDVGEFYVNSTAPSEDSSVTYDQF